VDIGDITNYCFDSIDDRRNIEGKGKHEKIYTHSGTKHFSIFLSTIKIQLTSAFNSHAFPSSVIKGKCKICVSTAKKSHKFLFEYAKQDETHN
jgi:hypothetical protein